MKTHGHGMQGVATAHGIPRYERRDAMAHTSHLRMGGSIALTVIAWVFLWTYLRTSLYAPFFATLAPLDPASAYIALVTLVLAAAACCAGLQARIDHLLGRTGPLVVAALAGTLAMAALQWPLHDAPAGIVNTAATIACLALVAMAFCTLFFAWVHESLRQTFELGVDVESVVLIVSAFASFALAFEAPDDAPRMVFAHVFGYVLAGACLITARRVNAPVTGQVSPDTAPPAPSDRLKKGAQQTMLLAVACVVVSFMSYAHYFGENDQTIRCGYVSDILLFVALGLFVAFMLYVNRAAFRRTRAALPMVLALVAVAFLALLLAMFLFMSSNVFAYGSSRFVQRLSLVIAGIATLVMIYRYDLPPTRTFAFAFLVPSLVMKPIQMTLYSFAPGVASTLSNSYAVSAAIAIGLVLTVFLVVFCLININDRLARILLPGGGPSVAEAAQPDRRNACNAIKKRCELTSRETDVLYHFSLGMSAQATADALAISTNTVNTHSMTLYRKLDVHTKQEVVALVETELHDSATA